MTLLPPGRPAPQFTAPTPSNPTFNFNSVAGRYVLLGFLPDEPAARDAALFAFADHRTLLDGVRALAFLVVRGEDAIGRARDGLGVRWFLDRDGEVSRLFGALSDTGEACPGWILLDPSLRVLFRGTIDAAAEMMARLRALPDPDDHAGVPMHAPVLIVPRVLDLAFCRELIAYYERVGGQPSGVMREVDGKTVGVLDDFKSRQDCLIVDEQLQARLRAYLAQRLVPEIFKAFQFQVTRIERYIVACYDADEGGYFRPHRDNTTAGTAHRKFAVTINLNAEEFEGGDLRFAEFGHRTYRAPTGGAVVFSCSLLHEATPVTRGRRYATLPFLYDDAGAEIRRRNLHLVQSPPSVEAGGDAVAQAE